MGSFSIWHWLVVLAVVALVFGTKKLRNLGGDLGSAVKGFKEAVNEENAPPVIDNASARSTADSDISQKVKS